ncbi:MAG: DUF2306 domain-containing protein [Ectothiorhodospiraceae bacterium]|nr:DUF2306 domain-containing protein [Ectothiorhodospiraceae bacterium]
MSLQPLLSAGSAVQIHVLAASMALVMGAVQFLLRRGGKPHRMLGWIWVLLMAVTAGSSFFIHMAQVIGPWSPIHLLAVFTLAALFFGLRAARLGDRRAHRRIMISLYMFALVGAGLFTLLPGRVMHAVLFAG